MHKLIFLAAGLALGAAGDYILHVEGAPVEISGLEAQCYAACAQADGALPGGVALSKLQKACAWRDNGSGTGFRAQTWYQKSYTPANLPDGPVIILGKE